jgi:dTDP-4-dehydrorhamnose reductase
MTTTAVIGANGQLGSDLVAAMSKAEHKVVELTHDIFDVTDAVRVYDALNSIRPDFVVNTAAMHNVEACEADPAQAFMVNGIGARNVAQACQKLNAYLVHISTDYVFSGEKNTPYVETDVAHPLNVYGNTKLSGENFVLAESPFGAVIRVSGVYGQHPCRAKKGINFVQLMIKLSAERDEVRVVDDEILTPTFAEDISMQILKMTEARPAGLFHATAQGACSWYEFAARIFERFGRSHKLYKARPGEFPAKVRRPCYSVLDNAALRSRGLDIMPPWQECLDRYLAQITRTQE